MISIGPDSQEYIVFVEKLREKGANQEACRAFFSRQFEALDILPANNYKPYLRSLASALRSARDNGYKVNIPERYAGLLAQLGI